MLEDLDTKCQRDNTFNRIKTRGARLRAGDNATPKDVPPNR
jgi:hypothetical protein